MQKILAELDFASIISESMAQTQTGCDMLNKYKSILMASESTCALVNNFIRESAGVVYDSGVVNVLEQVVDYVNSNKVSWALATACESINSNQKSYNFLNRNASKQVEKLLEMDEENVIKYIKAGALKNVMYCESFRNIAKQVHNDMPLVESTTEYTRIHPISMVENVGDGYCFEVRGTIYKMDDDKKIQEASPKEVSHDFKIVSQLLESDMVSVDNNEIVVKAPNAEYRIKEANKVTKISQNKSQEFTNEQMRENNRLVLMSTNPRFKNQLGGVLEAIALTCENYSSIVNMDNVSIYNTKNDSFVVIESGTDIYATLLKSNHSQKWTINENVIDALSFIKTKTNTTLSENYNEMINLKMDEVSEQEKEDIKKDLEDQKINNYKARIESLTEKFKNDPVKLAILSQMAQEINS